MNTIDEEEDEEEELEALPDDNLNNEFLALMRDLK